MTLYARPAPTKAELTTKKKCWRCRRKGLVLADFHRNNARKDGRQTWCRLCMNRIMKGIMAKKAAELRAFRLLKEMVVIAEKEATR